MTGDRLYTVKRLEGPERRPWVVLARVVRGERLIVSRHRSEEDAQRIAELLEGYRLDVAHGKD